jgi:hypothetical protein
MSAEHRARWRSVCRLTARDPGWLGFWLRWHRHTENLTPGRLAARLGVPPEGLIVLSLCRTPREEAFQEDLAIVCQRSGADPAVLARLLRQEQGLARWRAQAPPAQGWLMAASDRPSAPDEGPTPPTEPGKETTREP